MEVKRNSAERFDQASTNADIVTIILACSILVGSAIYGEPICIIIGIVGAIMTGVSGLILINILEGISLRCKERIEFEENVLNAVNNKMEVTENETNKK